MIQNCKLFFGGMLLMISNIALAQESSATQKCSYLKSRMPAHTTAAKTTVADVAEDNYDMKYVKLDIKADNQSTYIIGDVITIATPVVASLTSYVFELGAPLIIDSAMIDGVVMPVTTSGDVRTIALTTPIPSGTLFTIEIVYHGTPVTGTAFFSPGMSNLTSPSWGNKVTSTLSESYRAKDWWPCKQSLTDKIDSEDMWLTVPDTLKAGSNGILQAITHVDATHDRYEWKERIPIDYYLISLSIAGYVDYSYYMHYTGSTDSTLVQNYVYNNPATLPYFKSVIDSTGLMIDYFSTLYGRYPFWQEKYGHCMAPISGGMEHQTMTTLGYFEGTLVAHEFGHQWFGDNVTCGTWKDIMMNESFAAYTEYLFIDHFRTHTLATADIVDRHHNVKSQPGGSVYVDDTTSENRIFDSRLSYDKGACVLHMLRFIITDDSAFFHIYRNYQQTYALGTGTIQDFKNAVIGLVGPVVNGINIDTFFNQWLYLEGYPIYNVSWNQSGSDVYVQLDQATSVPSSVPLFTMPMEIKLRSTAGDTVVRIVNDQASQLLHFTWGNAMNNIIIDPNSWLVDSVHSYTHDLTLAAGSESLVSFTVHPNPASDKWIVSALQSGSDLVLTDMLGRILWTATVTANTTLAVPADKLDPGMYLLRVSNNGKITRTVKLAKD